MELHLIFLPVLGLAQIIIALVIVLRNRNEKLSEHMGYFLRGVFMYFAISLFLSEFQLRSSFLNTMEENHLYGGALLLSAYHLAILATKGRLFDAFGRRAGSIV